MIKRWQWVQGISFQLIWFAAVIGRNQWLPLTLLILLLYMAFSPARKADFKVLSIALLGITIDGILIALGIFEFQQPPLWLALLWLAFVLNFGHSLIFLRRLKYRWLMPLGACAGCYVYLLSWKLGAVDFPHGVLVTGVLMAAIWAALLPLLVRADQQLRVAQ